MREWRDRRGQSQSRSIRKEDGHTPANGHRREKDGDRDSKKEKDKHAVYAFTVNRRFQPTGDKGVHIVTTSLDIKSEHLREVGKAVIGQVQGISWTSRPLKVSAIDVKGSY